MVIPSGLECNVRLLILPTVLSSLKVEGGIRQLFAFHNFCLLHYDRGGEGRRLLHLLPRLLTSAIFQHR